MLQHSGQFSTVRMASVLQVSRSGYHRWAKGRHEPNLRAQKQLMRDQLILDAFQRSKSRSGARRIQKDLEDDGYPCCLKTIRASMKRQNLVPNVTVTCPN
ncbi:IS3 family transposase [Parendozoicomonas callyspongiae]|uniref:IS3 family transposase n=1 Tax=Parendozoicomonas callyspongiae TaxID=2942213 RepID=UPI0038CD860E